MPHVIEQTTVLFGVVIFLILHLNDLSVGGKQKSYAAKLLKGMWSGISNTRQNKTRAEVMQA